MKKKNTNSKEAKVKETVSTKANLLQQIPWIKITTVMSTLLLIVGTLAVIFYINGYRFTKEGEVKQTGVISITSSPSQATVHLDGEEIGKSPKTITTVEPGVHTLSISKNKYFPWLKSVNVIAEKSTPVKAYLFKIQPEVDEVLKIDDNLKKIEVDQLQQNIFITTDRNTQDSSVVTQVVKLPISNAIWEISTTPILIYDELHPVSDVITTTPSPDGSYLLMSITTGDTDKSEEEVTPQTTYKILETDQLDTNPIVLPSSLTELAQSIVWANDSTSLIIKTEEFIIRTNLPDLNQTILLTQNDTSPVWYTDDNGDFYYVQENDIVTTEDEDTDKDHEYPTTDTYFSILQQPANGSAEKTILDNIYFVDTDRYLQEETPALLQQPFKSSRNSTRFAGKITDIHIDITTDTLVINTEYGMYFYNPETEKFTVISPTPSTFKSYSPDQTKLLYTNDNAAYVFTFDKEEADHVTKLGSTPIIQTTASLQHISWHESSTNVIIVDREGTGVVDIDGDNNHLILAPGMFSASTVDGNDIFMIPTQVAESSNLVLNRYTLR